MLSLDDVSFSYGALAALRGVSARIARGERVGILGPNGSGKSTLLRLLMGALRPARGEVRLDGVPLASMPRGAIARRIAYVPQETRLAFDYSVLELTLMGRYPHLRAFELEGPADLEIARQALHMTGAAALEGRAFATLSGGEKQRVVIAAALAQQAEYLLLDEPTVSLDLRSRLEVGRLLKRINAEQGVTIVLATHDLDLAASVCQRLVLLKHGSVLASGPPAEVLTRESLGELFGVETAVRHEPVAGHITVTPLRPLP